jgi:DNA-binding phage protein
MHFSDSNRESLYKMLSERGNPEFGVSMPFCMRWGFGLRWLQTIHSKFTVVELDDR